MSPINLNFSIIIIILYIVIKINADVNSSYNIMRLGLDKINVKLDVLEIRPENKRFMLSPVSISII